LILSHPGGQTFVQIAAGANHVVALTNTGDIYSWGQSDLGQTGVTTNQQSTFAAKVDRGPIGNQQISGVTANYGHDFSAAYTYEGYAYIWGSHPTVSSAKPMAIDTTIVNLSHSTWDGLISQQIYSSVPFTCNSTIVNGTICGNGACIRGACNCTGISNHNAYCECLPGFSSSTCTAWSCNGTDSNDPTVCTSRGTCVKPDNCTCPEISFGKYCEQDSWYCNGIVFFNPQVCNG
jgi:hypothetical protein